MISCKKCNSQVREGDFYCVTCGAELSRCHSCNRIIGEREIQIKYCPLCGCAVEQKSPIPHKRNEKKWPPKATQEDKDFLEEVQETYRAWHYDHQTIMALVFARLRPEDVLKMSSEELSKVRGIGGSRLPYVILLRRQPKQGVVSDESEHMSAEMQLLALKNYPRNHNGMTVWYLDNWHITLHASYKLTKLLHWEDVIELPYSRLVEIFHEQGVYAYERCAAEVVVARKIWAMSLVK